MQVLWFLRSACRLMLINIYMKFCEDSLNSFPVTEQTQAWQTDRQPGKKTICLPTLKGGDIIKMLSAAVVTANWSGSAVFVIQYVNLIQQPGSSNLIDCNLEIGMTSLFIQHDKGYYNLSDFFSKIW